MGARAVLPRLPAWLVAPLVLAGRCLLGLACARISAETHVTAYVAVRADCIKVCGRVGKLSHATVWGHVCIHERPSVTLRQPDEQPPAAKITWRLRTPCKHVAALLSVSVYWKVCNDVSQCYALTPTILMIGLPAPSCCALHSVQTSRIAPHRQCTLLEEGQSVMDRQAGRITSCGTGYLQLKSIKERRPHQTPPTSGPVARGPGRRQALHHTARVLHLVKLPHTRTASQTLADTGWHSGSDPVHQQ